MPAQGGVGPLSDERPEWDMARRLTEEERIAVQRRKWTAYWDRVAAIGACASGAGWGQVPR